MIVDAISKLLGRKNLHLSEAEAAMGEIMSGQATPSQIAGFLVALRAKGETVEEIAGCALAMREAARPLSLKAEMILDNCGTGGDGHNGLNVSTAAAFVVAGAGYTVAKHGNRAVSSKCGSADVLEAMGIRIDPPLAVVEQSINDIGIGFMFAPAFHPAVKHAMPTRKELGVRTVFNILGPLANPARAHVQIIGVFKPELTSVMAEVMKRMGLKAGLVVHSEGWDEVTLHGKIQVNELLNGKVKAYTLTHKDFGLPKVAVKHLMGGDRNGNADHILKILENAPHPARNVVLANAAALVWITERAQGHKKYSLKDAVRKADESIVSGAALGKFRKMAEISQSIE